MQLWDDGGRGQYFHVLGRTANRVWCLDDEAKARFVELMGAVEAFSGVEVVTWALLDNHYHLVVYVPAAPVEEISDAVFWDRLGALYTEDELEDIRIRMETFHRLNPGATGMVQEKAYRQSFLDRMHNLSAFMKTLLQRFTMWFNRRHDRVGRLWEHRFKSLVVEGGGEALINVAAYVDLNAVRAGMVADPKDYRWCGYAEAVAGKRATQQLLGRHLMPDIVTPNGKSDWVAVSAEYRKLLFGIGEERVPVQSDREETWPTGADGERKGIPAEAVATVQAEGGRLTRAELLRCRIRYFSDGVVIGSKAFVEAFFEAKREYFGNKRRRGARPMSGGNWDGLHSVRALRDPVENPQRPGD